MKKLVTALVLCVMFTVVSCKNDTKQTDVESSMEQQQVAAFQHQQQEISARFTDSLHGVVFKHYIGLKTALINTDATKASTAASELLTAYSNIGVDDPVFTAAQTIAEATDVETQRRAFTEVTGHVESMLTDGLSSGAIYKQFCPMAFNNEGGYWLSESSEIANPYFGDKMYRCGKVTDEIK